MFNFFLIISGTELSKKHIRKSSSNSKIAPNESTSKVRTIEIKRETLQRSNSGSSDTSSGFGSLNNSENNPTTSTPNTQQNTQQALTCSTADIIKSKLDSLQGPSTTNPVTTKLQLLQDRRNKLSSGNNSTVQQSEHHPSFANHFGFAARYRDPSLMFPVSSIINNRNNFHRRIMNNSNNSANNCGNNKVKVTKSKSTMEYSKDSQTFR